MSNWYTRPPIDVPENAQKPQTVIYGPRGESLMQRVPRPVGFRAPDPIPDDEPGEDDPDVIDQPPTMED